MITSLDLRFLKTLGLLRDIAKSQAEKGVTIDIPVFALNEELGEFCAAVRSESGEKPRPLKENSQWEACDVLLCAVELYFMRGGSVEQLCTMLETKTAKWAKNIGYTTPKTETTFVQKCLAEHRKGGVPSKP